MSDKNIPYGVHPDAWKAFQLAGITAKDISQSIGTAAASAGTHEADGVANGHDYCAATDIRIKTLSANEMRALADKLAAVGFAPFIRRPGHDHWPSSEVLHLHAVYCGCAMKSSLRRQVHDYCHTPILNGLASHAPYEFWHPLTASVQVGRTLFLAHNPVNG